MMMRMIDVTCFCKWLNLLDLEKSIPTMCSLKSFDSSQLFPPIDDVDAFRDSFKFSCDDVDPNSAPVDDKLAVC